RSGRQGNKRREETEIGTEKAHAGHHFKERTCFVQRQVRPIMTIWRAPRGALDNSCACAPTAQPRSSLSPCRGRRCRRGGCCGFGIDIRRLGARLSPKTPSG